MHRKIQQDNSLSNGVPLLRLHCMQELLSDLGLERDDTEMYELWKGMDETVCGVVISQIVYEYGL